MSIDLSQFHQVFFEESFENLDIMEDSLMDLDVASIDDEAINAIFRAAHSIKGGSATFGFSAISAFTHILETLLDQVRAGERKISNDDVNLFLKSVDCIREMLTLLKAGEDADTDSSRELSANFTSILNAESVAEEADKVDPAGEVDVGGGDQMETWKIMFHPSLNVIKTGNDPLRIIRELSSMGELQCITRTDNLPTFENLDPESSYLYWDLSLKTDASLNDIEEVFEWVVDESVLLIERYDGSTSPVVATGSNTETFWTIEFSPNQEILRTGNDPVKIFEALKDIGELKSVEYRSSIPSFDAFDPELCFLKWTLFLAAGPDDHDRILEIFEWVVDESDIEIKSVSGIYTDIFEKSLSEKEAILKNQGSAKASAEVVEMTKPVLEVVEKAKPAKKSASKTGSASGESSSIRVGIDKVDNLINMVGELVITQSMLGQLGADFDLERLPKLLEGLAQLEQNTRELQESVMRIRMLPISFVFSRFPRMVRDLSQTLEKDIHLEVIGDQTELDKTVLEKIGDPLVHLVRNAVDHGIETPEVRRNAGKDEKGSVTLNAYHQGGNVVIEVSDDGKGLDANVLKTKAVEKGVLSAADAELLSQDQAYELIFHPGFSTAHEISDVSGRGVGMDVVKSNIQALNGVIDIHSELGQGSTITIRLPLTLAILDGQLVRVLDQTYIFPIVNIVESLQCKSEFINKVAGGSFVFRLRNDYVPIIQLGKVFEIENHVDDLDGSLIVVVESEGEKVGIIVHELLAQQQVVIKSLEQNYQRVDGISGATILGDGTVALIVDIPGIVRLASHDRLNLSGHENVVPHKQLNQSQRAGSR